MSRPVLTRIVLLLALAPAAFACTSEPKPVFRETTVWAKVGSWSSQASLQTESFVSETGSFRLTWTTKDEADTPGRLKVTLHSAVSGRPLVTAFEHDGPGGATTYVSEDPREFFLVVDAERTAWTLEVHEAARAAIRESPAP